MCDKHTLHPSGHQSRLLRRNTKTFLLAHNIVPLTDYYKDVKQLNTTQSPVHFRITMMMLSLEQIIRVQQTGTADSRLK